jgi:hypothetical protein
VAWRNNRREQHRLQLLTGFTFENLHVLSWLSALRAKRRDYFRRLRKDGICLLAGVVSYPWDHQSLRDDPVDSDAHSLWQQMTVGWLQEQFGRHLKSVVEHRDER